MTDALDRYLARDDADVRVRAALHCQSAGSCSGCPAQELGTCSSLRDTLLALAEELERARWMLERGDD
jgi:Fe-S cluster biogenesis protein NfuA